MSLELLSLVVIAMMPGIELRGSIPVGIAVYGMDPLLVFVVSLAASTVPGVAIVYAFSWIERRLIQRIGLLRRLYDYILCRIRGRIEGVRRRRSVYIGLALYVAVPLPLTGVWTGSLIAYLLGLDKRLSVAAVFAGNVVAGIVVTAASLGVLALPSLLS